MIDNIKEEALCNVKIEKGVLDAKCLPSYWVPLFKDFPASLPDMQFLVNKLNEPRVFKNNCTKDENWRECACDKGQKLPNHGFFIRTSSLIPIYEPVPIFSVSSYRPCFLDIIIPASYHIEDRLIHTENLVPWE